MSNCIKCNKTKFASFANPSVQRKDGQYQRAKCLGCGQCQMIKIEVTSPTPKPKRNRKKKDSTDGNNSSIK